MRYTRKKEKGGKTTVEVKGYLRYEDVDPDHVQTGPHLRGESLSVNLFTGPKIFL